MRAAATFVGHGNPMHAIVENKWAEAWREMGRNLSRPRAIVSVSAHWYISRTSCTAARKPRTIHDFGGFPKELFEVEYPAPGDPELAARLCELVGALTDCSLDDGWGLDHGTWAVLRHMYPDADIPVVQLSIDRTKTAEEHYDIGKSLRPLRDEGVLVLGSGNVVHNLHAASWGGEVTHPWAVSFETRAKELIIDGDHESLIAYESLGRESQLSIPTPDHYLPLLYVLGASDSADEVTYPTEGIDLGSVSMLSVLFDGR